MFTLIILGWTLARTYTKETCTLRSAHEYTLYSDVHTHTYAHEFGSKKVLSPTITH